MLALGGCDRISSLSVSASERFQLQAKCADEAREFESQWKKDNGTDFTVLMFRRHYDLAKGKCYSYVYFGNDPSQMWSAVYDALSGKTNLPLVLVIGVEEKHPQAIRDYMGDDAP